MNIAELPAEELKTIQEFRARVQDLIPKFKNNFLRHDLNLYRWLRARDLDLDKAEEMLRKHMEWRVKTDMDQIFSRHTPEEMEDSFPLLVSGIDREGFPVVCCHIGGWDFRKAKGPEGAQAFLMYVAKLFEQILEFCQHVTTQESYYIQFRGIFDFEGFEYRQVTNKDVVNLIRDVIYMFEDNYPELPKVICIINAPKLFQLVWSLIKPLLSERTLSKIQIHGTNKEKWQPIIFQDIDGDDIPSRYGGNITSCFNYKFKYGLDAFPRYETLPDKEMVESEIPAGKKHTININARAGSTLSWNFRTEQYDIGFRVDCDDTETIIKYTRVDSHMTLQKGMIVCQKTGKYTLLFDNSYSSFKAKKLKHVVRLYDD